MTNMPLSRKHRTGNKHVHHKPGNRYSVAANHARKSIASMYVNVCHLEFVIFDDGLLLLMWYLFASSQIVYGFHYVFDRLPKREVELCEQGAGGDEGGQG